MTLNVKDLPEETGLLHGTKHERMTILSFPVFCNNLESSYIGQVLE